jgi:putative DNA primase/helicase
MNTSAEAVRQFEAALRRRRIIPPQCIVVDGRIHRADVEGKPARNPDASYMLNLVGVPAGGYQNWTDGRGWENWCLTGARERLSPAEKVELEKKLRAAAASANAERREAQTRAAAKAQRLFGGAAPCNGHPYLTSKKVNGYGVRLLYGKVVVPLFCKDTIFNLQFIDGDGHKRFLRGGCISGAYYMIGEPDGTIYIAEGYATAATIHQVTDAAAVVGLFDSNLLRVAEAIREKYPTAKIIVCADDDWKTDGNPGRTHAEAAALAVSGLVAVPIFGDCRTNRETDFNDLFNASGAEAVRRCLGEARAPSPRQDDDAIIAELVQLSEFAYQKRREEAAKQLAVSLRVLDKEVARRRAEIEREAAPSLYPHWDVEPWDEPVDGGLLLRSLVERIKRHVFLPFEQAVAIALWVMMTWVHAEAAVHSPLLLVTSAEPNSGKSTLLGVIGFLARRSLLSVSITGPALFRSIEKWAPSFVIDEADTAFMNNADLKEVANSGWTRGQSVIRCDPETHEPRAFSTFAPKALGMKGRKLPDTTSSRAIIIQMKRKLPDDIVRDFDHVDDEGLARRRRQCLRWAIDNAEPLGKASPEIPAGFHNRVRANWKLLLAIAERAGGEWKQEAWRAAQAIEGRRTTLDASIGVQLLQAIRNIFSPGVECLLSREIIDRLIADPEQPWIEYSRGKPITQKQLARMLGAYGIISESVHPPGVTHGKGYKLASFQDAFQRYLTPQKPGSEAGKRASACGTGTSEDFRSGRTDDAPASENGDFSYSHAGSPACPLPRSENEQDSVSPVDLDHSRGATGLTPPDPKERVRWTF